MAEAVQLADAVRFDHGVVAGVAIGVQVAGEVTEQALA